MTIIDMIAYCLEQICPYGNHARTVDLQRGTGSILKSFGQQDLDRWRNSRFVFFWRAIGKVVLLPPFKYMEGDMRENPERNCEMVQKHGYGTLQGDDNAEVNNGMGRVAMRTETTAVDLQADLVNLQALIKDERCLDELTKLERKIMNQSDIEELCRKIYRRHAKALNRIYEIVGQGDSPLQSLMENALQELENDGKIIMCKDRGNYVKPAFHTKALDEYFGYKQGGSGSWGNNYLYVLWFERRDTSSLKLYFEVGPFQATDAEAAKLNSMAKAVNFKRNLSARYCRLWCYGRMSNAQEGADMKKLSDWVKSGVEEVLQQEKDWIEKANKELFHP